MKPCVKDPTPMKSRKRVIVNKFQKAPKRSSRRQVISRSLPDPEAGTLARKNKMTMLERRSVTPAIELQYGNYYQKYLSFCKDHGLELPPHLNTDINVADYMDLLFLEGRPMNEGEKLVASIEYHNPKLRGALTRSRRALKGWRKERPPGSRVPLPKLIAYGIAMKFLAAGKREQALKVVLDFDTYMRPGEIRPVSLSPSCSSQGRWSSVPVLRGDCQTIRGREARQGGSFRQYNFAGQQRKTLVGGFPPSSSEGKEDDRSHLSIHPRQFSGGLCTDGRTTQHQKSPSIPVETWRSSRRPQCQKQRLQCHQGTRPLGHRHFRPSIRENRQDPAIAQPTLSFRHGVLSLVTPKLGESAPGDNPTSTLVESPFQNVFQCQRKPHKFAVEIFAGRGRHSVIATTRCALFPH